MHTRLVPQLRTVLQEGLSLRVLGRDALAGVIVGIVALPLAIAFGIASGVSPEQGIATAIVAGFLIAALGGSRVQIGGPTGAFIVIVHGIVQQHGYPGLAVATLLAGGLLVLMGIARLGSIIKFIPYPVTVGFTAGIALIIGAAQLRDLLGLRMESEPAEFLAKWPAYAESLHTFNPAALAVGAGALLVIVLWPRVTRRVPGSLVAIIASAAAVRLLGLDVETIGSRFGTVSGALPAPSLPDMSWPLVQEMFQPAVTIALLAAIESLLSAVVADGMTGQRHRSNMELVAQGVANLASPLFGGIPATGAIARTATNVRNGGRTPIAGMVHALVLLFIVLAFGDWASQIPMAALAAILLVVAYNMSEWRHFVKLFRSPRSDVAILLTAFLLTVLVDLTVAIEVGVLLAALLFMRRMAEVTEVGYITTMMNQEEADASDPMTLATRAVPKDVEVFEVNGPFFFGAADRFKDALSRIARPPKVLILRLRHVPSVDATALQAVEYVYEKARHEGTILLLSGVHAQPLIALERSGLLEHIGEDNVHADIDDALDRARQVLGLPAVERPVRPAGDPDLVVGPGVTEDR